MRHIANVVSPQGVRGFESPPLRHPMRPALQPETRAPATRATTLLLAGALVSSLLAGACQVDRQLLINSQPQGAEVRVDGDPVGRTPVSVPFLHYGTRRVTFYLDGYLTQSQVVEVPPRWFNRFPLDLFSEVFVPTGWSDHRAIWAELEHGSGAIPPPALESVLERAELLRRAGPDGPIDPEEKPTEEPEIDGVPPPSSR
jgi:hypothetical protein